MYKKNLLILFNQYESKTFVDFTRPKLNLNNESNQKIKNLEIDNEKLKIQISNLSNELNNEKNNNQKLSQRIKELEKIINIKGEENLKEKSNLNIINEEKNLINELNEKLKNLNNNLNNNLNKDKLNELLEEIRMKDKIISNYPVKLSEGEQLMSVIFVSSDQNVHYSVICKNTDKFSRIESMLYDEYPEYSESENHFLVNGNKVNKHKSLEFNKIKNNDIIVLRNM